MDVWTEKKFSYGHAATLATYSVVLTGLSDSFSHYKDNIYLQSSTGQLGERLPLPLLGTKLQELETEVPVRQISKERIATFIPLGPKKESIVANKERC